MGKMSDKNIYSVSIISLNTYELCYYVFSSIKSMAKSLFEMIYSLFMNYCTVVNI